MNCEDCKSKGCIDTTCRTCWPKDDKSDVAEVNALIAGELSELMPVKLCPLGYCPICLLDGEMRERRLNGNDTCIQGHTYPSIEALKVPVRYPLDDKGLFHTTKYRQEIREHHREEGEVGNI